jgi:EAL domain-containing protein (putative c-di-GMP-specific phosphodiesterase class I)
MNLMRRALIAVLALSLAGCSSGSDSEGGFEFSLDETLSGLRNCDLLSETFVTVIKDATDQIDDLAASSNGRIPAAELSARVDELTGSGYFTVAERLGCDAVAQRVETIERLREIDPTSADGADLIGGVIEQLQAR